MPNGLLAPLVSRIRATFGGPESERWLRLAAGLALLHGLAWLLVPYWLFSLAHPWRPIVKVTGILLCAIDGVCAVAVTLALGRLLRERFRFQRAQRYVVGLAVSYSIGALFGMLGFVARLDFFLVVLVYTVPLALLLASLGLALLHVPRGQSRFVRPFAYLEIGTGMFIASLYFSALAPLLGAAGGIVLMLLFLEQAAGKTGYEMAGTPLPSESLRAPA